VSLVTLQRACGKACGSVSDAIAESTASDARPAGALSTNSTRSAVVDEEETGPPQKGSAAAIATAATTSERTSGKAQRTGFCQRFCRRAAVSTNAVVAKPTRWETSCERRLTIQGRRTPARNTSIHGLAKLRVAKTAVLITEEHPLPES
jgi:hypothetical protein